MKKISLVFFFFGLVFFAHSQSLPDTLSVPVYNFFAEPGYAADLSDEEDYASFFLPAVTGNGNYLAMGQLSRNLIGVRFRPRGYDNRWQRHEVNGAELFDPGDGFPYWNMLSAINLLDRTHYDVSGLSFSRNGIGAAGGTTSISTMDTYVPVSRRVSYARTNRNYSDRIQLSASVLLNRWMIRAGANYRGGKDGFVTGLDSRRGSLALSVGRDFNGHTLNVLVAAYESEQGVRSAATQEVYDLIGDNYYNPNWGWQGGEIRNSKNRGYRQGMGIFSYQGRLTDQWNVDASFSVFGGENSFSQLAWYDAPTPYADYYRYLPGFFPNQETADPLREEWRSGNPDLTQINWRKLYEANAYNVDENGIARSHYIVRDLVTDKRNTAFSGSLEYRPDRRLQLRGGLRFRSDYADNFARLKDLSGGRYWLDIDQYLLDDEYYGGMYQNDLRHPNRPVIAAGDRLGYNYRMRSNSLKIWGTAEYTTFRWSAFAALEAGSMSYQRDGRYEKEMFPGNLSYGLSEKIRFQEYTVKAGLFYHFSLRHRIALQATTGKYAPLAKSLFIAPDYRNEVVPEPQNVHMSGAELIYQWMSPRLKLDLTGYVTTFRNETEIRNYYDDIEGEYFNLVMSGLDKIHAGVELGVEWNVTPRVALSGVLSANVYQYDSDPRVTLYRDSDGKVMLSDAASYLSGYRLPGTPQTAGMIQLNYRTRSYWRFELSGKYTAHNYVSVNPVRRMTRALDLAGSPEIRRQMAEQERLDNAFLIGFSVSKSFRFRDGSRIGLWINADNLLDDRSIRYSGYEQWRFSKTSSTGGTLLPFPSKYYYAYGVNYYAMISYTF